MSFWSSVTVKAKCSNSSTALVNPYNEALVQRGAYELTLGPQAAISCDGPNKIIHLKDRDALCIPRGQFALLLTEERVNVPHNVLGLISLKTKIKCQGLINVSGFHVDPGYDRRLKFWVYNAGNEDIHIQRGDATFLIWFAEMDHTATDFYNKAGPQNDEITADDLRNLKGTLASPAFLSKQLEGMEHKIRMFEWVGGTALLILVSLCVALATPLLENTIRPIFDRFTHNAQTPLVTPASPNNEGQANGVK